MPNGRFLPSGDPTPDHSRVPCDCKFKPLDSGEPNISAPNIDDLEPKFLPASQPEEPAAVGESGAIPVAEGEDIEKLADIPDYIDPSFNVRLLKRKLEDPKCTESDCARLLLGLHYKLWHLPLGEMRQFLKKGWYPEWIYPVLTATIPWKCKECMQWKRTLTKPVSGGGSLATFFNERLQTDLFTLWQRIYIIWVDQATRWTLAQHMATKDKEEYLRIFLSHWVRYFGAPVTIVSDQEGAVISDLIGRACEAFGMTRELAGSEGHTRTGIAERKIGVVKLTALKLYAQTQRQGMKTSQDDCVYEAAMCCNSFLVYGTNTPNQAVLGYEPRDLYSMDNEALSAYKDARSTLPDAIESAIRLRLMAKEAIVAAIIENRISECANSKVQQYTPEEVAKLVPGTKVDIYREPESKEISGWKGPADLIHTIPAENKAVVQWRGHPMGLPLRHVRPHVGFTWLIAPVSSDSTRDVMSAEIAATLMDLIEDHATGQTFTYGNLWSTEKQAFYCVPDTLQENPPRVFTLAKEVSSSILQFAPVLGVQFGTGCKATEALVNIP